MSRVFNPCVQDLGHDVANVGGHVRRRPSAAKVPQAYNLSKRNLSGLNASRKRVCCDAGLFRADQFGIFDTRAGKSLIKGGILKIALLPSTLTKHKGILRKFTSFLRENALVHMDGARREEFKHYVLIITFLSKQTGAMYVKMSCQTLSGLWCLNSTRW
jgi:hypothetical protein